MIGVNLSLLSSILKFDMSEFYMYRNSNKMLSIVRGGKDSGERQFDMFLLNLIHDELDIPYQMPYTNSVSILSTDFARICRDLRACGGSEVGIKFCDGQLVFSTHGQICAATISINAAQHENDSATEMVWFTLEYLSALDTSLAKYVWLYVSSEKVPLKIKYDVCTSEGQVCGSVCVYLAPRIHVED